MERQKIRYGITGILAGSIALLLALMHFWAGPFSPRPTIETVVAEKVSFVRSAALDALHGKEPVRQYTTERWDIDKAIAVLTALLGGLAVILGTISFATKEPLRVAGGAAALGVCAIALQFLAMHAMALLVVLLIVAVLSSLGLG